MRSERALRTQSPRTLSEEIDTVRRNHIVLLGLVVGALALRAAALGGDLWLDEIMSHESVSGLTSPTQILSLHHDNNHLLNSLWLWIFRGVHEPWLLRFFSFLCGALTILTLLRSDGPALFGRTFPEKFFVLLLWSISYPMVLYESEARGYAAMVCGGVVSWYAAARYLSGASAGALLLFWAATAFSVLGHLSGIQWFLVVACWTIAAPWLGEAPRQTVWRLLGLTVPPALGIVALWHIFGTHLPEGSGTLRPAHEVIISAASVGFGGPSLSPQAPLATLIACVWAISMAALCLRAAVVLYRGAPASAIAAMVGIIVAPLVSVLLFEPRVLYERYFLSSMAIATLLLSSFLAREFVSEGARRRFAVVSVGIILIGSAWNVASLLSYHRGDYQGAIQVIQSDDSSTATIPVAVDHDFRWQSVLRYHQKKGGGGARIEVIEDSSRARWYLVHSQDPWWRPSERICPEPHACFVLRRCQSAALWSGWGWCVYEKEVKPAQDP